jgi:plastocyanin
MLRRIASLCSFLGILSLVQGSSSTGYPSATSTSKAAATHTVSVGDGGFFFSPNTTYANVGDVVQFDFYPTNHSVVRAEYQFPCIPYDDTGLGKIGFFSGFQPVIAIIQGKVKLRSSCVMWLPFCNCCTRAAHDLVEVTS